MRQGMNRLRSSSGQVLVLFAVALPLLFSLSALVVDGTGLMVGKRQMQNAADASALAAAQELTPAAAAAEACAGAPACEDAVRVAHASTVAAAAGEYSEKNGGPPSVEQCANVEDTNCYTWPYDGSFEKVEVRVTQSVSGFFTKLTGMDRVVDVAARSVASTTPVETVAPDTVIPGTPAQTITVGAVGEEPLTVPGETITIPATPAVTLPGATSTTDTTIGLDE